MLAAHRYSYLTLPPYLADQAVQLNMQYGWTCNTAGHATCVYMAVLDEI